MSKTTILPSPFRMSRISGFPLSNLKRTSIFFASPSTDSLRTKVSSSCVASHIASNSFCNLSTLLVLSKYHIHDIVLFLLFPKCSTAYPGTNACEPLVSENTNSTNFSTSRGCSDRIFGGRVHITLPNLVKSNT